MILYLELLGVGPVKKNTLYNEKAFSRKEKVQLKAFFHSSGFREQNSATSTRCHDGK